jgi:hypothetical protein
MKRRLLNLLTALSLAAWVAVVVLWVRSYVVTNSLNLTRADPVRQTRTNYALENTRGRFVLVRVREEIYARWVYESRNKRWKPGWAWRSRVPGPGTELPWRGLGFELTAERFDPPPGDETRYMHVAVVPHWFLALPSALLPALWAVSAARRRRAVKPGSCPKCGYDLRATPGRCPECGRAASVTREG